MESRWYWFLLRFLCVTPLDFPPPQFLTSALALGHVVTVVDHNSLAVDNFRMLLGLFRLLLDESKHISPNVLRDITDLPTELIDHQSRDYRGSVLPFLS